MLVLHGTTNSFVIKSKGHFIPSPYFHLNGSIKIEIEAVSRPQLHTKPNYCYSEDSFVYFTERKYF